MDAFRLLPGLCRVVAASFVVVAVAVAVVAFYAAFALGPLSISPPSFVTPASLVAFQSAFQLSLAPPLATSTVVVAVLVTVRPAVVFRPPFISFQAPSVDPSAIAFSVEATTAVAAAVVVGRGGGCVFLAGHALNMCLEALHDQH